MDDEIESTGGHRARSFLRWLGAAAAIAGIVGVVFQVIEWAGSRTAPSTEASAAVTSTSQIAARANGDEQFVQAGQCVRIVGDADSLALKIATCGPGTQRVVTRVEETITDEAQADALCAKEAPDFTDYHYSNWEKRSDYIDVVFCLRPS